jgi:iron only hydrogenase large subunit-like protein
VSKCLANAALADDSKLIAQISQAFIPALEREYAFAAGVITTGKITAALKFLGFDKVYDAAEAVNFSNAEINGEVHARKNASGGGKLPVITGCSEGVGNYVRNFYPDLAAHLIAEKTPRRIFTSLIKNGYAKEAGLDSSKITTVSFVPCIAQKYAPTASEKNDFAITAVELARMIKLAGIIIENLPEETFDTVNIDLPKQDSPVEKETANGFAQGRKIMEAIQEGKCKAQWVEILSCPSVL